jgi:hypothetical protein
MSRMTYPHLYRKFLQLLEANDLEGLRFLLSLIDRHFPEQKDISISLNVYLLSQEEDDEKACDLLDEALQHGVWWHPSTLDRSPFLFEQYQFPCLWLVVEGLFLKISKN